MIRTTILIFAIIAIGGAIWYLGSLKAHPSTSMTSSPPSQDENMLQKEDNNLKNLSTSTQKTIMNIQEDKAKKYEKYHEITNPSGFINTDPITIRSLIGKKVILVDFWTYSCINCQRTLPYLNGWYEKYKDKGFEIVSIHTPEFGFEKEKTNVQTAVKKYGITYPVVMDNDYGTWTAYNNRYWPRKYLIDIDGYIVYDHIGEGRYDETETKIQKLLNERKERLELTDSVPSDMLHPDAIQVSATQVLSPEIYFGAARNTYLGNGKEGKTGEQTLTGPTGIKTNILYMVGNWNFDSEYAENTNPAKIIFRYNAKNVYMVASSNDGASMKIVLDGKPVSSDFAGEDVLSGEVYVKESSLYKLIKGDSYGEHTLELIIDKPGLKAFTFTFG